MILLSKTNQIKDKIRELAPFIGNTPLFPLHHLINRPGVQLFAKLEWEQLSGSVKARAAYHIIRDLVLREELVPGKALLDASSGNTGIAFASICRAINMPLTLCLPENASQMRKDILRALGTEIELTSKFGGTDDAQERAKELSEMHPNRFVYADQYNNPQNWRAHYEETAEEIWAQTEGQISHFVAGLGTTGTFMGISRRLRELQPNARSIALQPDSALHGLEGWKHLETAKVPGIYASAEVDEHRSVRTEDAWAAARLAASKTGLLLSPSSGAALAGALSLARELKTGIVVTIFADDARKYPEFIQQLYQS